MIDTVMIVLFSVLGGLLGWFVVRFILGLVGKQLTPVPWPWVVAIAALPIVLVIVEKATSEATYTVIGVAVILLAGAWILTIPLRTGKKLPVSLKVIVGVGLAIALWSILEAVLLD
jgi:membrane-bound ClpP family serine protease